MVSVCDYHIQWRHQVQVFRMYYNLEKVNTVGQILSGFLSFIFMLISFLLSRPFFRRNYFELFYYSHIMIASLIYIFAGLHKPQLLTWIWPSIILLAIDFIIIISNWQKYIVINLFS